MFRVSSKKALGHELKCRVNLLVPGEELELSYTVTSVGQDLIDSLVKELGLVDKDYYGLKFHDQIQWLDPTKAVLKQTKNMGPIVFELRFKYYPAEPALLGNEMTRYYLYMQLRLDLVEGRLRSESEDALAYLLACIMQSELGDYSASTGKENYVSEFKFVPNQTEELERAAIAWHQNEDFIGLRAAESELNFLKKACRLDTYGIDPYPVKEGNSHNHFLIGVNYRGILTFQDSRLTNLFSWSEIERITMDNKLVLIYCRKIERKGDKMSKSKPLFGFRCPSQAYAHNFWKISTEHRYFFTLESSPEAPIVTNTGGLFKKSHKLKYVGRVEKDLLRDNLDSSLTKPGRGVRRSHSLMSKMSSDGPRWQGFQQGRDLQSSLKNIYNATSAEHQLNKTAPSDLGFLPEGNDDEEEDEDEDGFVNGSETCYANNNNLRRESGLESGGRGSRGGVTVFSSSGVKRNSTSGGSPGRLTRKPLLTSKEPVTGSRLNAIRKGSQVYMDTEATSGDGQSQDLLSSTLALVGAFMVFLLVILLINDSDRPSSVSLIVRKLQLESVSSSLRQNYYLPLRSAVRDGLGRALSLFE